MNSITNHEIVAQLDRILASSNFLHSSVLAKFLGHVVHETIEGRGHELKEYTIGVAALKKDTDFNPQIDSIVRIHAGRLRRALRDYYQTEGVNDPIAIVVPKGGYVPSFGVNTLSNVATISQNQGPAESRALAQPLMSREVRIQGRPTVYVAQFKVVTSDHVEIHTSLQEYLSSELTKFEELAVISDDADDATAQRADYIVRGTIHMVKRRIRVFVYLLDRDSRQHWSNSFNMSLDELWQMEEEVVARTVAAIAGINGVISRVEAQQMALYSADHNQRPFSYWYKQHVNHFDPFKTQAAKMYYEDVVLQMSDNALATAYLSEITCRQAFFEDSSERPALLSKALDLARQALLTDPTCQQAYQAMALITMVMGRSEESARYIEKGLSLNSNSVDFQAAVGAILIQLGRYERGKELLEHALELLPDPTWGQLVSLAIHAFHHKAYHDALAWLDQTKVDTYWSLLLKAAAAVHANEGEVAREALLTFRSNYPKLNPTDKSFINNLFPVAEMANAIHLALQKAGDVDMYLAMPDHGHVSKRAHRRLNR